MMASERLTPPLLMDGNTVALYSTRQGAEESHLLAQWMTDHPHQSLVAQQEFLSAGCDILTISDHWTPQNHQGNLSGVLALREAVGTHGMVAGAMGPTGLICEPFGDTPYLELMNLYAHRALALRDAGVEILLLDQMVSLAEARAALLGARQAGLPVYVSFAVDQEGRTSTEADLLSCLIVLQHLGAAAVGFHYPGDRISTLQLLGHIAPYATVPIFVRLTAQGVTQEYLEGFSISPSQMEAYATQALRAGAGILAAGQGTTPEHMAAIKQAVTQFEPEDCVIEKDTETLVAACADQPFFLDPDHLEFSQPIPCYSDMSDDIIAAEDAGCDVLCVQVETVEDAYNLGLNAHMFRLPVCIAADSTEALEAALLYYVGRALVDSLSDIDPDQLQELAKGYGAIVI